MKKIFPILLLILNTVTSFAQDQTINGNMNVKGNVIVRGAVNPTPFGEWGKYLQFGVWAENGDAIYFSRVNTENDQSELRLVLGNDGSEKFAIGYTYYADGLWKEKIVFKANGTVGIGVSNPTCPLDVNGTIKGTKLDIAGTIRSKEVKIEATGWSDFVFAKDYQLPSLQSVEQHINDKGHLPDIPSEKEIMSEGINVGEMQAKLLQKIEELTLYVIDLKKKNEKLEKRVVELENR